MRSCFEYAHRSSAACANRLEMSICRYIDRYTHTSVLLCADEIGITACRTLPDARLQALHYGVHGAKSIRAIKLAAVELVIRTGRLGNHLILSVSTMSLCTFDILGIDLCLGRAVVMVDVRWLCGWI